MLGSRALASALLVTLLVTLPAARPALAQKSDTLPPGVKAITDQIKIEPVLGTKLPLDRTFTDHNGKKVRLGDYFDGKKPVLFTLMYYRCPMLCGEVLNQTLDSLKQIDWTPGNEFDVLTLSINEKENATLAKLNRQKYLQKLGRPIATKGVDFLVGREPDIRAVADSVGFGYVRTDDEANPIAHGAAIYILTPNGELHSCLKPAPNSATWFLPRTIKYKLLEASEGKQGSFVDGFLHWCFAYDPENYNYSVQATAIMKIAGGLTVLILASILLPVWLKSRRRKGPDADATTKE
jgi:protein SCO1/2